MVQLADLFSVPEMYLMSTVTEFFNRNHIDYHPEILFRDVKVGQWRVFSSCLQKYLRLLVRVKFPATNRIFLVANFVPLAFDVDRNIPILLT